MLWDHIPGFEFHSPARLVFGWGKRTEIGSLIAGWGRRAFIVCGSKTLIAQGELDRLREQLLQAGFQPVVLGTIAHEPEVADIDHFVSQVREQDCGPGDWLVAFGGGSAMDTAKGVAALATNRQGASVLDFLEGVGTGARLVADPLPWIAIPTTAGTGSEATKNAVITSYDPPFKKSLRSEKLVARLVIVDPELTVSVPPHITAWTGLDALTQLIESFVTKKRKPMAQALAAQGMQGFIPALRRAYADGNDRPAREILSQGAYFSGLALANSGLGLAHGVAAAMGAHCKTPHGLACAAMLPGVMRFNAAVVEYEFSVIGELITGRKWATPRTALAAGLEIIDQLLDDLRIPRTLSALGISGELIPALVCSSHGNSREGNPRPVSDADVNELLESMR